MVLHKARMQVCENMYYVYFFLNILSPVFAAIRLAVLKSLYIFLV